MKYSAQHEILNSQNLAEIAWNAIEPIWNDLPYSNPKRLRTFISELTKGQQALISIDWCQKVIRNDGIYHLFTSSTGNLVPYAIDGLHLIGAQPYAEILSKSCKLLGTKYPESTRERKKVLQSLVSERKKKLEKLENEFIYLINSDNSIEVYRGSFVLNNPNEFISS